MINDCEITVSKIVVSNPLAIGGTDKSIRNLIDTWESDIKYYENYLYDKSLIVGKYYRIENGKKIADKRVTAIGFEGTDNFKQVFVLRKEGAEEGKNDLPSDVKVQFYDENKEKEMILDAFKKISEYPFVITYNGDDFDMPYLYNRAQRLGIKQEENPF